MVLGTVHGVANDFVQEMLTILRVDAKWSRCDVGFRFGHEDPPSSPTLNGPFTEVLGVYIFISNTSINLPNS